MKSNRPKRASLLTFLLFMAIVSASSCQKIQENGPRQTGIELSDLLGTWKFTNTFSSDYTRDLIGGELTLTLHDDLTYTDPDMNFSDINRFDFTDTRFRMLVHRGVPMTHLNHYYVFEGEMVVAGLLSGKIYPTSPPKYNEPMGSRSDSEIGTFTATLIYH